MDRPLVSVRDLTRTYRLGDVDTPPAEVFANYRRFRGWARTVLDPAAQARGLTSCEMCHRHVSNLPTYRDG